MLKLHKKDQIRAVKFGPSIVGFLSDAGKWQVYNLILFEDKILNFLSPCEDNK